MGGAVVPPAGVVGAAVVAAGVVAAGVGEEGAVDAGGVVGGSTAGSVSTCMRIRPRGSRTHTAAHGVLDAVYSTDVIIRARRCEGVIVGKGRILRAR